MQISQMFCDACGAANRTQARFCFQCGTRLPQAVQSISQGASLLTGRLGYGMQLARHYTIQRLLGQGGMGAVYLVEDLRFAAKRAVKELSLSGLNPQEQQEAAEAFKREAMLLARLSHPNLPRIYDHFEANGRWYLVMDYIEGQTLEEALSKSPKGFLTVARTLPLALQLCTVLDYLHSQQPPIIFRDLKPGNIMLTRDEHVYLIDFGIARLFKPGQANDTIALGSPGYAAPEQYGKAQTTASADIYSLGATLHHALSGNDPGTNPFQFAPLRLPQKPGLPELEALILQMVETKVQQRPTSMQEIKKALQAISQQSANEAARTQQSKQAGGSTLPTASVTSTPQSPPAQGQGQSSLPPTEEIIVDKAGSGQYSSISEALKNASPHARILVRPGIYQESLVLDKPIEISGSGPVEQVVIECSSGNCMKMASDVATVRQLTLRGCAGQDTLYYTINIPRGHLLLEQCHVTSNSGACIGIYNAGASVTIRHCQIHDSPSNGIYIHTAGQAVIEDCDLSELEKPAIALGQTTKVLIRRCKIHDNNSNGIYISEEQKQVAIEECEIFRNGSSGVAIREKGHAVIRRCQIHDSRGNGIYIGEKGRETIEECEIYRNEKPNIFITGESEALLRRCKVYESKSNGIYLQDKSKSTVEDCEIYRNETRQLDITGESDASIYRCKIYEGESGGIGLYDKSKALIERCDLHHDKSTLIFSTSESNLTLKKCSIHNGESNGINIKGKTTGLIEECDLYDMHAQYPTLWIGDDNKLVVRKCKVHHGKSNGIYLNASQATIEECEIHHQAKSGLDIDGQGNPLIERCQIHHCEPYGIYARKDAGGTVRDCTLRDNVKGAWHSEEGSRVSFSG